MKGRYYKKPAASYKRADPDDAFVLHKVYIPKSASKILREKSEATGFAMSRLVAIAVDNELDVAVPFNYPCEIPQGPQVDYAYAESAGLLLKFLERFPSGTQRESIMLCRRDIGIPSRATLMAAYRELLSQDVIEEYVNRTQPGIIHARVKGLTREEIHEKKFKRVEGLSTRHQRTLTDEDIER